MREEELRQIVTGLVTQLLEEGRSPSGEGAEAHNLCDRSAVELSKVYQVPEPKNGPAFCRLKEKTPARLGLWRAGPRYTTASLLRLRGDHAAAQDAVFSQVEENFPQQAGYVPVQTLCDNKDTYLTRPDLGRRFGPEAQQVICATLGTGPKVALVVGDGLSSAAIEQNARPCMDAICRGLQKRGIDYAPVLFVRYCRVGASDHIGSLTGAEVVCMLVGERPGLVTAESMSAYVTYGAQIGVRESQRTVISNIHRGGTSAEEAGEQIAALIEAMLRHQLSGVELKAKLAQRP